MLNVSKLGATLMQTEKFFVGAYASFVKRTILEKLRAGKMGIINLGKVTSKRTPRVGRRVSKFSTVGRRCLERAKLRAERQYI